MDPWIIAPITAIASIIASVYLYSYINRQDSGTANMREIAASIKEGANAFLRREYRILAIFVVIVAILIAIFLPSPIWINDKPLDNLSMSLVYIFGASFSALAGYLGMDVATRANVKTANAAKEGLNKAFPIGFRGGAVMGLSVVGFSLLGISIVYGVTKNPDLVLGFSFGASALALFAKAGGGIYTKTADISADLVGKVELNIPEDDPRNPAVIADNVGDNVGDVAGMGADLADSYIASIVAVMILGQVLGFIEIPLVFAGLGIIASIIGVATIRVGKEGDPGRALNLGTYLTCIIYAVLTYLASTYLGYNLHIWGAVLVGLIAGVIIGITSDYFTSIDRMPTRKTAETSLSGAALNIITGFSYGLYSVLPSLVGIGIASVVSYYLCYQIGIGSGLETEYALFGVGMAAMGMLSVVGMIVASDAYGPIVDNAKGIAEQSGLEEEVVDITDKLDAAGNTAKAITKGFAIGAAGLTVLALLAAFNTTAKEAGVNVVFDLMDPVVLLGIFIGIAIPSVFAAMLMLGVGRNANRMIEEVRRQFDEILGLREGREGVKPDYARCVDIATVGALRELLPASVFAIVATLAVGFVGGIKALGGYLSGSIFCGLLFALLMSNSGGLWDNAKKYIESGAFGGKGSEAHKAAVIGDTVGDPFKDTAGPSLNTLITVMSLVSTLFAVLIAKYNLLSLLL